MGPGRRASASRRHRMRRVYTVTACSNLFTCRTRARGRRPRRHSVRARIRLARRVACLRPRAAAAGSAAPASTSAGDRHRRCRDRPPYRGRAVVPVRRKPHRACVREFWNLRCREPDTLIGAPKSQTMPDYLDGLTGQPRLLFGSRSNRPGQPLQPPASPTWGPRSTSHPPVTNCSSRVPSRWPTASGRLLGRRPRPSSVPAGHLLPSGSSEMVSSSQAPSSKSHHQQPIHPELRPAVLRQAAGRDHVLQERQSTAAARPHPHALTATACSTAPFWPRRNWPVAACACPAPSPHSSRPRASA